jgi:hypothetical protein
MADLSVAQRVALAQVIAGRPDTMLGRLATAVARMPGDRARSLEAMLADAGRDRMRRARGMAALAPMFRPRADGVCGVRFPAPVMTRLWSIVAQRQADMMRYLDLRSGREEDVIQITAACVRLWATAAAAVRDQPDAVWPETIAVVSGQPGDREARLEALAQLCDLGGLAVRALPMLKTWIGRPDADQLAELRLMVRDAAAISDNGARDFIEILSAHLADAPLVLRLVVNSSHAAERSAFLSGSELATFVNRLIDAAEVRAAAIARYKAGEAIDALCADLQWLFDFLIEIDATVTVQPDSVWGKRIRRVRLGVSEVLSELLEWAGRTVDKILPMARVQTAGRMTRKLPNLDAPLYDISMAAAETALDLIRFLRTVTAPFGCDAQRQMLVADLMEQLVNYADLALEEINAGVVIDEPLAGRRVMMAADFLERLEAVSDARAVRRRVAVSGVPAHGVSPKAA